MARELTKIHEEFVRGTAAEVAAAFSSRDEVKGEVVVLVGPSRTPAREPSAEEILARFQEHRAAGRTPGTRLPRRQLSYGSHAGGCTGPFTAPRRRFAFRPRARYSR